MAQRRGYSRFYILASVVVFVVFVVSVVVVFVFVFVLNNKKAPFGA